MLAPLKNARFNGAEIHIHYDFPATTIAEISATIHAVLEQKYLTPVQRLYLFIASYMEANERDYLARPPGWHNDIRYIYAHYHARQRHNKRAAYKKTMAKNTLTNKGLPL